MKKDNVGTSAVADLIRVWGVRKVMDAVCSLLRKQGSAEKSLAADFERALEHYEKKKK